MEIEEIRKEVEEMKDLLGLPVDPKIKELVMGLRIWQVRTISSCQGHKGRGMPYPWIGFTYASLARVEKAIYHHQQFENKDKINWTIKQIGIFTKGSWILIPENKKLSLVKLQTGAKVFAEFLQSNKDLNMS